MPPIPVGLGPPSCIFEGSESLPPLDVPVSIKLPKPEAPTFCLAACDSHAVEIRRTAGESIDKIDAPGTIERELTADVIVPGTGSRPDPRDLPQRRYLSNKAAPKLTRVVQGVADLYIGRAT